MDTSTVENGCIKVLAESHRHYPEENHTVFLNEEQINQLLESSTLRNTWNAPPAKRCYCTTACSSGRANHITITHSIYGRH